MRTCPSRGRGKLVHCHRSFVVIVTAFALGAAACSKSDIQPEKLSGHALVFRSGGIKLYPTLRRSSVVTVNADRAVWPTEISEAFEDPRRGGCAIILYRLEALGQFVGSNRFSATQVRRVATVDAEERKAMLETLKLSALDNPMNCPSG